jgi:plasmid maintenance system antidote protein VapI
VIVHGKRRRLRADTARRLARHFGSPHPFWFDLQTQDYPETLKAGSAPIEQIHPLSSGWAGA